MSALLIIDLQNDFVEGGALAVPDGGSIVPLINALAEKNVWDYVIATKDWHPPNHVSFASAHPGLKPFEPLKLRSGSKSFESTSWPDHCVQQTHGAELVSSLDLSHIDKVLEKGSDPSVEFYSAFQDVFQDTSSELDSFLRHHHVHEVTVVGLAEEFCVLNTALDAARLGYATSVILDATKPISAQGARVAEQKLIEAGVKLVSCSREGGIM